MISASPNATAESQKPLWLPSYGDFLFAIVLLFQIQLLPSFIFGDASTGWHIALGDYVLNKHDVPRYDFMSYTFAGAPWISFYWLPDTLMAEAARLAGTNGIAVLVAGAIAWLYLALYNTCRKMGANALLSSLLVLIGASASTIHWIARPHVMTFIGTYVFATALASFHRNEITARRLLITLAISMLVWVNSHGGFIIGFICLAVYMFSAFIGALFNESAEARGKNRWQVKILSWATLACGLLTLVNPFGFALHCNLANYLGMNKLVDSVSEYLSPIFHYSVQSLSLEIIFFWLLLALAATKKRATLPETLLVVLFFHLALNAGRNIPLFIIVALPYIAQLSSQTIISDYLTMLRKRLPLINNLLASADSINAHINTVEPRCNRHVIPVMLLLFFSISALNGGKLFGKEVMNCGFDPNRVPTTTLKCIAENKLQPTKGFNEVNWGGYLFWKTKNPNFIDDRGSFFGEDFYMQYGRVISLFPDWKDILNKYKITWIIFPKNHPFSQRLKLEPEWRILCQDEAAYVFVRKLP